MYQQVLVYLRLGFKILKIVVILFCILYFNNYKDQRCFKKIESIKALAWKDYYQNIYRKEYQLLELSNKNLQEQKKNQIKIENIKSHSGLILKSNNRKKGDIQLALCIMQNFNDLNYVCE
jgi:hypothetical protein